MLTALAFGAAENFSMIHFAPTVAKANFCGPPTPFSGSERTDWKPACGESDETSRSTCVGRCSAAPSPRLISNDSRDTTLSPKPMTRLGGDWPEATSVAAVAALPSASAFSAAASAEGSLAYSSLATGSASRLIGSASRAGTGPDVQSARPANRAAATVLRHDGHDRARSPPASAMVNRRVGFPAIACPADSFAANLACTPAYRTARLVPNAAPPSKNGGFHGRRYRQTQARDGSIQRLEERDDVGTVLRLREALEHHLGAGREGLRADQPVRQPRLVPCAAPALQRRRIGVARSRAGIAADHPAEIGSNLVLAGFVGRVAVRAAREQHLATLRARRAGRLAGGRDLGHRAAHFRDELVVAQDIVGRRAHHLVAGEAGLLLGVEAVCLLRRIGGVVPVAVADVLGDVLAPARLLLHQAVEEQVALLEDAVGAGDRLAGRINLRFVDFHDEHRAIRKLAVLLGALGRDRVGVEIAHLPVVGPIVDAIQDVLARVVVARQRDAGRIGHRKACGQSASRCDQGGQPDCCRSLHSWIPLCGAICQTGRWAPSCF